MGANLEVFRFSIYLFFPLAVMVHYGDPQWYHDNVLPYRDRFLPKETPAGQTPFKQPKNSKDLQEQLHEHRVTRFGREKAEEIARILAAERNSSGASSLSLRSSELLGRFSSFQRTGVRSEEAAATWREQWPEARQGRVV